MLGLRLLLLPECLLFVLSLDTVLELGLLVGNCGGVMVCWSRVWGWCVDWGMGLLLWDWAVLLDLGKSLLEFLNLSAGLLCFVVVVFLSGVVRVVHWSVVSGCWGVVWSIVVRGLVVEVMLVMGFVMDWHLVDWGMVRVVVDWLVSDHMLVAFNWLSVLCGWVEDVVVVMGLHLILFLELGGEGVLLVVHVLLLNVMLLLHFEFGDALSGLLELPLDVLLSLKDFLLMMELLL